MRTGCPQMRYAFAVFGMLAAFAVDSSFAQETASTGADSTGLCIQVRSVLVDGVLSPLDVGVSGSLDLDFVRIPSSNLATFGLRFGVDHYMPANPGGSSASTDYDIFIRHTASGRVLRFDMYFGYCYFSHIGQGGVKFGIEFRFKLAEHFLGLLAKLSAPLGLGLSGGWDR